VAFFAAFYIELPAEEARALSASLSRSHWRYISKDTCQGRFVHLYTQSNHLSKEFCQRKFSPVYGGFIRKEEGVSTLCSNPKVNANSLLSLVTRYYSCEANTARNRSDRPVAGGRVGGSSPTLPPEFLEVKNITVNAPKIYMIKTN